MPHENIFLLAYFIAFFLLAFVIRTIIVYRNTGVNPLVLASTQDVYGYVGTAFKILMLACAVVVVVLATSPNAASWLGAIYPLQLAWVKWAGWGCLGLSLLFMLIAQIQMGASWRIGIDNTNRTELVSTGLFGISRNPIFLATRVILLGFFFVVPNAITLAILAVGEVLTQVQVRLEEKHMSNLHPAAYDHYASKVPRWL
jgi:protein-S-isoprenylcysteine O-methyltransferase Ste14